MADQTTKIQGVTFVHADHWKGNVVVSKDGESVKVPVAALRMFVAETIRAAEIEKLQNAKREELLSR